MSGDLERMEDVEMEKNKMKKFQLYFNLVTNLLVYPVDIIIVLQSVVKD